MTRVLPFLLAASLHAQWKPVASIAGVEALAAAPGGSLYAAIPREGRIVRLSARGKIEQSIANTNVPSGIALDRTGRLIVCERSDSARRHARVVRLDASGAPETLAEAYGGKGLTGPRWVAVDPEGRAFVADPPASILRIDDAGRGAQIMSGSAVGDVRGVALSMDGRTLYLARDRAIDAVALDLGGNLSSRRLFHQASGTINGLCVGQDGSVYTAAEDGLLVLSAKGESVRRVRMKGGLTACAVDGQAVFAATAQRIVRLR